MLFRRVVPFVVLLAAYGVLSFLNEPRGYLGTDTGGKVATLEGMVADGDLDVDVGYWAEPEDPDGRFHPLYYTAHVGERWVNVTTLPLLVAAQPLYDLGGYRLSLLLPMIGAAATALAAAALVQRLGGDDRLAVWVVGLASPVVIYALDLWEHSLGLALMAWAMVVVVDALDEPVWWRGALAGVLFGAAATMRTEALVYATVGVGLVVGLTWWRQRDGRGVLRAVLYGGSAVAGALVPLVANTALEVAILGEPFRSDRAGQTAERAGEQIGARIEEAIATTVNLQASLSTRAYVVGFVAAALLFLLARAARRPGDQRAWLLFGGVATVVYVLRFGEGIGFVPGMLAATPIAVAGLALGWDRVRERQVLALALLPLPLVWAFQFKGGAAPQWAGRYVLCSGFLLLCVGLAALPRIARPVAVYFVALSVAVTAFGVVNLSDRSHEIAKSGEWFTDRGDRVVVSTIAHQAREYGAFYPDMQWLTVPVADEQDDAVDVLRSAGVEEFDLVQRLPAEPAPEFAGFEVAGEDEVDFLSGVPVRVTTYEAATAP